MSQRLRYLFHQYFNKTETAAERDELMRLIIQHDSEAAVHDLMEEMYKIYHFDENPFPAGSREKMLGAVLAGNDSDNLDATIVPIRKSQRWFTYASAAILILALSFGAYQYRSKIGLRTMTANKMHHDIIPGGNRAILTLANGSKIELNGAQNGKLVQQGNTAVVKLSNGSLAYVPGVSSTGTPLINTMSTPRGGQYKVQLPDGTVVILNAESSVSYPTTFVGGSRNVSITGEVYFEVAKNKKMPFIVSFENQKVEVLGTHFDIRAYNGQPLKTTLLEGAVKISSGTEKKLLVPGQQAVYDPGAKSFDIKMVDTEDIVAWKNGLFVFDSTNIDEVMVELSRWYDIALEYNGPKPSLSFTGLIKKDITLQKH